jgi:hypothetical protein
MLTLASRNVQILTQKALLGVPEWVSNVEIYTHERGEDAVWGSSRYSLYLLY